MKAGFLGLLLMVASVASAEAWTRTLTWGAVAGATTYKVERSTDSGATWVVVAPSLTAPSFVYMGTETGLVLFRITACNVNGCAVQPGYGIWHSEAWALPARPVSIMAQ